MKYYTKVSKIPVDEEVFFKDRFDCGCQPNIIDGKRFTRFQCDMCGYSIQDIEFLEAMVKWNKINMTASEIVEAIE